MPCKYGGDGGRNFNRWRPRGVERDQACAMQVAPNKRGQTRSWRALGPTRSRWSFLPRSALSLQVDAARVRSLGFSAVVALEQRKTEIIHRYKKHTAMPSKFAKVQKQVSKKKGGALALHENSRDALRLRSAVARDDRVARLGAVREKANDVYRMCPFTCFDLTHPILTDPSSSQPYPLPPGRDTRPATPLDRRRSA